MPITGAVTTRAAAMSDIVAKMCSGPKKKAKKVEFVEVFKTGNPYHAKSGLFTSKVRVGAPEHFDEKDKMRIANLMKEGDKATARAAQMAKSITTWDKAHRRANAATAAGQHEMAKIFRSRADAIRGETKTSPETHVPAAQVANAHVNGTSDLTGQPVAATPSVSVVASALGPKNTGSAFEQYMQAKTTVVTPAAPAAPAVSFHDLPAPRGPVESGTVRFRNPEQAAIFEMEMKGQVSDGMWENSPKNKWETVSNAKVDYARHPGEEVKSQVQTSRSYAFASKQLREYVGDRMIEQAKLVREVGLDRALAIDRTPHGKLTAEDHAAVARANARTDYGPKELHRDLTEMQKLVNARHSLVA